MKRQIEILSIRNLSIGMFFLLSLVFGTLSEGHLIKDDNLWLKIFFAWGICGMIAVSLIMPIFDKINWLNRDLRGK